MQLYGVVALAPSVARLKNLGALEDRVTAEQELCAINRRGFEDKPCSHRASFSFVRHQRRGGGWVQLDAGNAFRDSIRKSSIRPITELSWAWNCNASSSSPSLPRAPDLTAI